MQNKPDIDAVVADAAPDEMGLTDYDEIHLIHYLRLLDAADADADWREVALIVLKRDPATDPDRTRRCYDSHLARARWMTTSGYRHLLEDGPD